jgi:hypothetical protein
VNSQESIAIICKMLESVFPDAQLVSILVVESKNRKEDDVNVVAYHSLETAIPKDRVRPLCHMAADRYIETMAHVVKNHLANYEERTDA